jgi:hypothetical protein
MAEGSQFWTGQSPAGYTGRGDSWVAPSSTATDIITKVKGAFEADKTRIADEERQRIEFGREVDMPIEGWDTDIKKQLSTQLTTMRQFYSRSMANGVNPLDPTNAKEYQEYHKMRDRLKTNMTSSTEQQGTYKDSLKKLLADNGKVYDLDASYANLEKYRAGKIGQRADMTDMLVPRIKSKPDAMKDIFDHFKEQTLGTAEYDSATGQLKHNSLTKMPIGDMLNHVKQMYEDPEDQMGASLREMFPDQKDMSSRESSLAGGKVVGSGWEEVKGYVENMYQDYSSKVDTWGREWAPQADKNSAAQARLAENRGRIQRNRPTTINTVKTFKDTDKEGNVTTGTRTGTSQVTAVQQFGFDPVDIQLTGSNNMIGMDGLAVEPSSQTYNMKVGDVQLMPVYNRTGKSSSGHPVPKGSVIPDDILEKEKAAGNVSYEVMAFGTYDHRGRETSVYFPAEDIAGRLQDEYVPLGSMTSERNTLNREIARNQQTSKPNTGEVEKPVVDPALEVEEVGQGGTLAPIEMDSTTKANALTDI